MINAIRSDAIPIQLTVGMLFYFQSFNFRVGQHNNQILLAHNFRNQTIGPQLFLRLNSPSKITTLFRCFEALKLPRMSTFRTFKNFAQKEITGNLNSFFTKQFTKRNVGGNKKQMIFLRVSIHSRFSQKIALKKTTYMNNVLFEIENTRVPILLIGLPERSLFEGNKKLNNLKYENVRSSIGRLRQDIAPKSAPHVQHDYFPSFNQSNH